MVRVHIPDPRGVTQMVRGISDKDVFVGPIPTFPTGLAALPPVDFPGENCHNGENSKMVVCNLAGPNGIF